MPHRVAILLGVGFAVGCSSAQSTDAGTETDAAGDLATSDALPSDGSTVDGGSLTDAGVTDAGRDDATGPDAGDGGVVRGAGGMRTCPAGATMVGPTDDLESAVTAAAAGATICVSGAHRIAAALALKTGQTVLGIDATARIAGAAVLDGWTAAGPGAWEYSGPLAMTAPHLGPADLGGGHPPCYEVSSYQDDVFFDDVRMMRVLSLAQLLGTDPLPPGQAVTDGEMGRFFFDYAGGHVYVDHDPTGHVLELATVDRLVVGHGASGVTLDNLAIEVARNTAIDGTGATGWTVRSCTIRYAHQIGVHPGTGVSGAPFLLVDDVIAGNGQYGLSGAAEFVALRNVELAWNNIANYRGFFPATGTCGEYWGAGAAKFVLSSGGSATDPSLELTDVESHHNVGDGFWNDIRTRYVRVTGGRFHDNERNGYLQEISCDLEISGAELDHNGLALKNPDIAPSAVGLDVHDSNGGDFHDNLVHDNPGGGILLRWLPHTGLSGLNGECLGVTTPAGDGDVSGALMHNHVHDNRIYECTGVTGERSAPALGTTSATARDNHFDGNAYHVVDPASVFWADETNMNWASWGAASHDVSGSAVMGCAAP